mmetsp:Transcript_38708/g.123046  ORF Transcript_38708/g.123046 Transcript_38708/m.123046 type:complete len:429 (+) Transcript_38708:235-1521(+)
MSAGAANHDRLWAALSDSRCDSKIKNNAEAASGPSWQPQRRQGPTSSSSAHALLLRRCLTADATLKMMLRQPPAPARSLKGGKAPARRGKPGSGLAVAHADEAREAADGQVAVLPRAPKDVQGRGARRGPRQLEGPDPLAELALLAVEDADEAARQRLGQGLLFEGGPRPLGQATVACARACSATAGREDAAERVLRQLLEVAPHVAQLDVDLHGAVPSQERQRPHLPELGKGDVDKRVHLPPAVVAGEVRRHLLADGLQGLAQEGVQGPQARRVDAHLGHVAELRVLGDLPPLALGLRGRVDPLPFPVEDVVRGDVRSGPLEPRAQRGEHLDVVAALCALGELHLHRRPHGQLRGAVGLDTTVDITFVHPRRLLVAVSIVYGDEKHHIGRGEDGGCGGRPFCCPGQGTVPNVIKPARKTQGKIARQR